MTRSIQTTVTGSLEDVAQSNAITLAEAFMNADYVILVDQSGSMGAKDVPGGQSRFDAADGELARLQEAYPGKCAVIAFSSEVRFCPSGRPTRFGGGTDMAAALRYVLSMDGLDMKLFLISDGHPDSGSETLAAARLFTDIVLHTVYIGPESGTGRRFLEQLAEEMGGKAVTSTAADIADDVEILMLNHGGTIEL